MSFRPERPELSSYTSAVACNAEYPPIEEVSKKEWENAQPVAKFNVTDKTISADEVIKRTGQ